MACYREKFTLLYVRGRPVPVSVLPFVCFVIATSDDDLIGGNIQRIFVK
jgi:hypothetical protein